MFEIAQPALITCYLELPLLEGEEAFDQGHEQVHKGHAVELEAKQQKAMNDCTMVQVTKLMCFSCRT